MFTLILGKQLIDSSSERCISHHTKKEDLKRNIMIYSGAYDEIYNYILGILFLSQLKTNKFSKLHDLWFEHCPLYSPSLTFLPKEC